MKKIYKNWAVHNLIGHPLMQIMNWLNKNDIAKKIHDGTLPDPPDIQ